jgi:hypothetical protein
MKRVQISCRGWWLEMNHGFMSMIRKQKGSEEWKHGGLLRSKKACKNLSKIKIMLIVLFDIWGVVCHGFVPQGQTVNAAFYVEVLKRLRECVRCVRPELWTEKNRILHHDNAPLCLALIVCEFPPPPKKTTWYPWITLPIHLI